MVTGIRSYVGTTNQVRAQKGRIVPSFTPTTVLMPLPKGGRRLQVALGTMVKEVKRDREAGLEQNKGLMRTSSCTYHHLPALA